MNPAVRQEVHVIRRLAFAALLLSPLAGLAAEPTAPAKGQLLGSCSPAPVSCTDYEKTVGTAARDACKKYKLTWSDGACPTEKRVGTCVTKEGGGKAFTHSYPPGTAEVAKKACGNTPGGVFLP